MTGVGGKASLIVPPTCFKQFPKPLSRICYCRYIVTLDSQYHLFIVFAVVVPRPRSDAPEIHPLQYSKDSSHYLHFENESTNHEPSPSSRAFGWSVLIQAPAHNSHLPLR